METEQTEKKDLEFLGKVLSNKPLLKFVALNGADNIKEEIPNDFKECLSTNEDSLMLMSKDNVNALITEARFTGKALVTLSLERLNEITKIMNHTKDKEAVLKIVKEDYPAFICGDNNVMILAPKIGD